MKIYTKTGDKGTTSLLGGTRVQKSDPRIEAYGTVDELNSSLGMLIVLFPKEEEFLLNCQHKLFNIGSLLACECDVSFQLPTVTDEDILALEHKIDAYNNHLPLLKNFILPGGSKASAQAQICRTICRRAERRIIELEGDNYEILVKYLNRFSDFLFVLAREILFHEGKKEILWKP